MKWHFLLICIALFSILIPVATYTGSPVFETVSGQVPDPGNQTIPAAPRWGDQIYITASPAEAFLTVRENSVATWNIRVRDATLEPLVFFPAIQVQCMVRPDTPGAQNWAAQLPPPVSVGRGDERLVPVNLNVGMLPKPEVFQIEVTCRAGGVLNNQVIAQFPLTARVEDYDYMGLRQVDPPPVLRPDERFTYRMDVVNLGNRDRVFRGAVEAPEGWVVTYPDHVVVGAGSSETVVIEGIAPRDKLVYRYESTFITASYWPSTSPEKAQTRQIPVMVNGLYMHPAIAPFVLLGLVALVLLVLLLIFARRTVEEEILGKPVPPWRIPVERAYLAELEKTDPDEYYIVRYYLMVEEHRSALLWFYNYKRATRKDRKHERRWVKLSRRSDRKMQALQARLARRTQHLERRMARPPRWRGRKRAALDRRVLRAQWKEQRKLLKIHRDSVKRVHKLHRADAAAIMKRHERSRQQELKQLEKTNRKRTKAGEEPLPVPPEQAPVIREPTFPELVEVPIVDAEQSQYALRAERLERRAARRSAAANRYAERRRAGPLARLAARMARVQEARPVEPKSHLYDEDEYISSDDVVVVDDRGFVAKLLGRPTLEEADEMRRRALVVRARCKDAKRRGDRDEAGRIRAEWAAEKQHRRASRRARGERGSERPRQRRTERDERATEPPIAAGTPQGKQPNNEPPSED